MEQHHVVARQLQAALHGRLEHALDRQVQFEGQPGVARRRRFVREMLDPAQHGAGRHILEEFLHRAGCIALDIEQGVEHGQVGDHGFDIRQSHAPRGGRVAADFHARPLENKAALDFFRLRPQRRLARQRSVFRQFARCIIQNAVLELAGHAEVAAIALGGRVGLEGEMLEFAAQAQADIARHAAFQRARQPVAQVLGRLQRQIAADGVDLEIVDRARQVDLAQILAIERHAVRALQGDAQALLIEVQLVQPDLQHIARFKGPARLHGELFERQGRLAQVGGELQHQVLRVDGNAAALVIGVDAAGQVVEAGNGRRSRLCRAGRRLRHSQARRLRIQAQIDELAAQTVAGGRGHLAFPLR